jgi:hypothetical protein
MIFSIYVYIKLYELRLIEEWSFISLFNLIYVIEC